MHIRPAATRPTGARAIRPCLLGLALSLLLSAGACGDDHGYSSTFCRFEPDDCGGGQAGAVCDRDDDCLGICCRDNGNCRGGMCTYECHDDRDCPHDMACEHGVCFYACTEDDDCARGQSCEHGETVCEWR